MTITEKVGRPKWGWKPPVSKYKNRINRGKRVYQAGAHYKSLITHCPAGHPYRGANLRINTAGSRLCMKCRKFNNKKKHFKGTAKQLRELIDQESKY